MSTPSVGERVDQLERDVAQLWKQNVELAAMVSRQSEMLARLLQSLGESAESLPGEKPIAPARAPRVKAS